MAEETVCDEGHDLSDDQGVATIVVGWLLSPFPWVMEYIAVGRQMARPVTMSTMISSRPGCLVHMGHNIVVFDGGGVSQGPLVHVLPTVLLGYIGAWESTAPLCVLVLIPTVGLAKAVPDDGIHVLVHGVLIGGCLAGRCCPR